MKTLMIPLAALLALWFGFVPADAWGQGSLTPPGAPGPTMKTLDQLEPRTDVLKLAGDSTSLHIIRQPGSYYLTTNVVSTFGSAGGILVATNDVTLDLNGFGVIGSGGFATGIQVEASRTNVTVRNGLVRGWGAGGVITLQNSQSVTLENLTVGDDDAGGGIVLLGTGVVRECRVGQTGGGANGIFARYRVVISNCTVRQSGSYGILVETNCVVTGCYVEKTQRSGIRAEQGGSCEIIGNTCIENNLSTNAGDGGIAAFSPANRIDGNRVVRGPTAGITIWSFPAYSNNVVIRNFVSGMGEASYVTPGSQVVGPIINSIGTITNSNPWANFAF